MNYYKRHIGDYAAATRHLSLLEHGVYGLMLDVYYTSEKPLPLDLKAVQRLIGARSKEEREAVGTVLQDFFVQGEDGWHQARCDQEIAHKQEKSKVNQELGSLGGRPKAITESVIPENRNGLQTVSTAETESNPSHKPIANSQYSHELPIGSSSPGSPGLPDCPHLELIDLFGQKLPELPQPKPELWSGKSADHMRQRWRWVLTATKRDKSRYATTKAEALDWFGRFFGYVATSDFLMGRRGDFGCSLQWLMNPTNFGKVVQGNYDNKEAAHAPR